MRKAIRYGLGPTGYNTGYGATAGQLGNAAQFGVSGGSGLSNIAGPNYYVSASGSDSNNGSQAHPWLTLEHARDTLQPLLATQTKSLYVNIVGLQYRSTLFTLDAGDSGQNGFRVVYRGASAGSGLSGGVVVTGWTLFDATRNIWRASYTGVPRNLYVGDVRCRRSFAFLPPGTTVTGTGLDLSASVDPDYLDGISNPADAEIIWHQAWQEYRTPVTAVGTGTVTISTDALAEVQTAVSGQGLLAVNQLRGVENVYEHFFAAGATRTFYANTSTNHLYLIPPAGVDPSTVTVTAPVIERLIDMDTVEAVDLSGLTFKHTNCTQPSEDEGFVVIQANVCYVAGGPGVYILPATITLTDCVDCDILGCELTALGSEGLHLENGCDSCQVVGNYIHDVSGQGIMVGHPNTPTVGTTDIRIANNLIRECGAEFQGSVSVISWYGTGLIIEHNDIGYCPYSCISLGWGWGSDYLTNINDDGIVRRNHVHHYNLRMTDGAGIYQNGHWIGCDITYNLVHDGGRNNDTDITTPFSSIQRAAALYSDNGCSNTLWDHNVAYRIGDANIIQFNNQSLGGGADSGNNTLSNTTVDVRDTVTTSPPENPNTLNATSQVGLAAAITAGAALNAGLEAPYTALLVAHPDTTDTTYRNGLLAEYLPENSSSSGSTVALTRVVDSSGNHNDLVQLTALSRMSFVPNAVNGYPVFRDGSADSLTASSKDKWTTMIILTKLADLADGVMAITTGNGASNGFNMIGYGGKRNALYCGVSFLEDGDLVAGTWEMWVFRRTAGGTYTLRVNGVDKALTVPSGAPVAPFGTIRCDIHGDVRMIRIYDRALTDAQADAIYTLYAAQVA